MSQVDKNAILKQRNQEVKAAVERARQGRQVEERKVEMEKKAQRHKKRQVCAMVEGIFSTPQKGDLSFRLQFFTHIYFSENIFPFGLSFYDSTFLLTLTLKEDKKYKTTLSNLSF